MVSLIRRAHVSCKSHPHYGKNVLTTPETGRTDIIYFLSGSVISMVVPRGVLSEGWK